MSKFLHLGMPLSDIGSEDHLDARLRHRAGARDRHIAAGGDADAFVFSIEQGAFPLQDTHGKVVNASRRIKPHRIMRAGAWDMGQGARPLRPLRECDYEVFRNLEESA